MPSVINEQIVTLGQAHAQAVQGGNDLGAGGIRQQRHRKVVHIAQELGHGDRIIDGGLQRPQVGVVIYANDQGLQWPKSTVA
jgi:hypothetical protein